MLSAFTSRLMTREHRSLIRQLCGYLWVGANRSPLLKLRQMRSPLMPMPLGLCDSGARSDMDSRTARGSW